MLSTPFGYSEFDRDFWSFRTQNDTARRNDRRAATIQVSQSSGNRSGHLSNPCPRWSIPDPAGVLHPLGLSRFHIRPTFGFQPLDISAIIRVPAQPGQIRDISDMKHIINIIVPYPPMIPILPPRFIVRFCHLYGLFDLFEVVLVVVCHNTRNLAGLKAL